MKRFLKIIGLQALTAWLLRLSTISYLMLTFTLMVSTVNADEAIVFKEHSLGTFCYSASQMKVTYGKLVTHACGRWTRAKTPKDETRFPNAILGLTAFAGILQIQWLSKEGEALYTELDLEEIFPGKVVLHNEDPATLDKTMPLLTPPIIVVEVNDRTLSIYMDTYMGVRTNDPDKPRRGSFNYVLAYRKTF